jgi:HEAT repeat protein
MAAPSPAPTQVSDAYRILNAVQAFDTFVRGREADRNEADRRLNDPSYPIDRAELRRRLAEYVQTHCGAGGPLMKRGWDLSSTRAWLLYALGRVANGEKNAVALLEQHLNPSSDPDPWVRYWTFSGLARAGDPETKRLVKAVLGDPVKQVSMLGVAVLAADNDENALREMQDALEKDDDDLRWAALRALRIVTVDDETVIGAMLSIIDQGANSDITYDAIRAVRHIHSKSRFAREAARSLATFVERWRTFGGRDSMRAQALIGLGKMKVEATAPVLIEDLIDYNPSIVREAARSLEAILGTRTAVVRVVEAASKADDNSLSAYARALGWMEDRSGDSGEAERWFRREAEQHSGMIPNTIGA